MEPEEAEAIKSAHKLKLKGLYNVVVAQTISASGRFLFAATKFSDIFVFDIADMTNPDQQQSKPQQYHQRGPIDLNSLAFHHNYLIVGAAGIIYGLKWCEDELELSSTRCWEIKIPFNRSSECVEPEVNCLWLRQSTNFLYAGCGDSIVYKFDLEDGRQVREFREHDDFIHGVSGNAEQNAIYSASEDGTVRVWSEDQKQSIAKIEPSTNENLKRSNFGKWIGAIDVRDSWLLCGGGPKMSLWNMNTMDLVENYDYPGKIHVTAFVDDKLFVGGEYNCARFYEFNGSTYSNIPVEQTASYSIIWQNKPVELLSIAGFSNYLHVVKDFRFLDRKVEMY